jgi:hypothetical protein
MVTPGISGLERLLGAAALAMLSVVRFYYLPKGPKQGPAVESRALIDHVSRLERNFTQALAACFCLSSSGRSDW